MTPEILTLVSVLSGAVIGSLSTLAVTWINKRFDDRRARRELAVSTALANWKQNIDLAIKKQGEGKTVIIPPIDDFIIHMLILSDHLLDRQLDTEKLKEALRETKKIMDSIREFRDGPKQDV
jgi:hypothetical protein